MVLDKTVLEQLLSTESIIESICNWNSARYEQEFNHDLTCNLLEEELGELGEAYEANDPVAALDGLGDIFYVAIGGLWKHGYDAKAITNIMDYIYQNTVALPNVAVCVYWYRTEAEVSPLASVALAAHDRMAKLLNSQDKALDVVRAICVSNDTKAVKKTASNVKANIDKGTSYVSPTEAITKIWESCNERN